jgi:hypothetical protein
LTTESGARYGQLLAVENDSKELVVEKEELQKFKLGGIRNWIFTIATKIPIARPARTREEQNRWFEELADLESGAEESGFGTLDGSEEIGSPAKILPMKNKAKSRK